MTTTTERIRALNELRKAHRPRWRPCRDQWDAGLSGARSRSWRSRRSIASPPQHPHGEHDFSLIEIAGHHHVQIDYYDIV
jgi:hypothetical protein